MTDNRREARAIRRESTEQRRESTAQRRESTAQRRESTAQRRESTAQRRESTAQRRESTAQRRESTAIRWARCSTPREPPDVPPGARAPRTARTGGDEGSKTADRGSTIADGGSTTPTLVASQKKNRNRSQVGQLESMRIACELRHFDANTPLKQPCEPSSPII